MRQNRLRTAFANSLQTRRVNAVGYSDKTLQQGIFYTVAQFTSMKSADGGMTLGDFVPGGKWTMGVTDTLTLKNNGNKFEIVDGLMSVFCYVDADCLATAIEDDQYYIENWEDEGLTEDDVIELQEEVALLEKSVPGWYLYSKGAQWAKGNFNNYPLTLGMGILMSTQKAGCTLRTVGEVNSEDLAFNLAQGIYYTGNGTAVNRTLGDLIPGGKWTMGVTDTLTLKQNGNKFEIVDGLMSVFCYVDADCLATAIEDDQYYIENWEDEGLTEDDVIELQEEVALLEKSVPGWYLYSKGAQWAKGNFNSRPVAAGDGFILSTQKSGCSLTVPAAY